ncbi:hypothetical protein N9954_05445 [Maribacter sp.]|nr:hypothetical protein [Maribacter sp.]
MGKLEKYTASEWEIVSSTPQLVGVAMAGAGSSGLVGSTKEMFASARGMMSARKEYEGNQVLQAILPDTTSPSTAMEDAKAQRAIVMGRLKEHAVKSSEELQRFVLEDCEKAIEILERHEVPDVVQGYKKMVLDLAEKVANAAKEGDFLGFGGERFSEKEQKLFAELKNRLG